MDRAAAFLEAIRDQPDDDAPRLIFADWLEEHGGAGGHARATFVRAQCALARLPANDPARPELEDAARGLLAEHGAEWAGPLAGVADDWEFRRGFVEWAHLSGDALLRHGDALFAALPLRDLRLRPAPDQAARAGACPHLARLERLDLGGARLRDRPLEELFGPSRMPRLRELDLTGNEVEGPAVRALAAAGILGRLDRLGVSGNHSFGDRAARALVAACGTATSLPLRGLALADTNLTSYGVRDLLVSRFLAGIEELDVSTSHRARSLDPVLAELTVDTVHPRLTDLNLGGNLGGDFVAHRLARDGLRRLGLRGCRLGEGSVRALCHIPGLTALDLGDNALGPDAAGTLATAENLSALRGLDLAGNRIRDKGTKDLAASPFLSNLEVLDLSRNGMGGPGVRALAESASLAGLTDMSLSGNYVSGEALAALLATPRFARLGLARIHLGPDGARLLAEGPLPGRYTELDLSGNRIGDAGAAALAASPLLRHLTRLDLSANGIGPIGAAALVRSRYLACGLRLSLAKNDLDDAARAELATRFGRPVLR